MKIAIFAAISLFLCGCSKTTQLPSVSVTKCGPEMGDGEMAVDGVLKNDSTSRLNNLTITFAVYFHSNKMDDASAEIATLGTNETWAFQAITAKGFDTFKLESVTATWGGGSGELSVSNN